MKRILQPKGDFIILQEDQDKLRKYLLGKLDEADEEQVELRLLADDGFGREYEITVDELVDQYVEGDFPTEDRQRFEQYFFESSERRRKLRFALAIKSHNAATAAAAGKHPKTDLPVELHHRFAPRKLSPIYLRVAAGIIVAMGIGLVGWLLMGGRSDAEEGMNALREVYKYRRPVEARITSFDYAPLVVTRGPEEPNFDDVARDRAERLLLDAVSNHPDDQSHLALGRFYLASKQFDKAIKQFENALTLNPRNALAHNDLGATLLEAGKQEAPGNDAVKPLESFAKSLEHIEQALQIDPTLSAALYNKALVLQHMMLREQAKAAWQSYLSHDSQSQWTEEAKRNLQLLFQQSTAPPTAPQLLDDFLAAARAHNDGRAWQLMSHNREMITGKLLSQQIAMASLKESLQNRREASDNLLQALTYAGSLELERARDPYVSDMAAFYSRSSPEQRMIMSQAHVRVLAGYNFCLQTKYKDALEQFVQARALFDKAQDEWESKLCDYWVAYCYSQMDKLRESTSLLTSLAEYCQNKNYKWLLGQTTCWLATNHAELGEHSKSVENYRRALSIAEDIDDTYNNQKVLSQLASEYNQLGQSQRALDYHWRSLKLTDSGNSSFRQQWRNNLYTARTLVTLNLYAAAAAFGGEMLHLALENIKEPGVIHYSYLYLGQIYGGQQRFEEAFRLTSASLDIGRSLKDEFAARKLSAYSMLQAAHLQRQRGNCAEALANYNQAIQTYDQMELSVYKYNARKGRLLCYVNLEDDQHIENELPIVLDQFEQYRSKIFEEQNRNTFFDREQSVYDIAINHAYTKGDYPRVFEYSEASRARSLLDSRNNHARLTGTASNSETSFTSVSRPLNLQEIQGRMPANVQVVQYTVLRDKTLIWVITKDSFKSEVKNVSAHDLQVKTSAYIKNLMSNPAARNNLNDLARELYDMLVEPVAGMLDPQKVLCIIPDKSLFYLPFAALVAPRTGHYLINDFTLLNSPSLNVFILCTESSHEKAGKESETLLSVGNPDFDRTDYPNLADLPAAAREANEIADNYSSVYKFIGADAVKVSIEQKLPDADIVHFACHYVANERYPMSSKLVLAKSRASADADDGCITARDLVGRKLPRAKLVILSACQTSGERYYNGEGMIGISRTFLATGIPLVVASQWPVDSESTAELMMKFHRYRKLQGLSTVAALRRAQLDMLNERNGLYSNPYYWAGFMPVGGHTDF